MPTSFVVAFVAGLAFIAVTLGLCTVLLSETPRRPGHPVLYALIGAWLGLLTGVALGVAAGLTLITGVVGGTLSGAAAASLLGLLARRLVRDSRQAPSECGQ